MAPSHSCKSDVTALRFCLWDAGAPPSISFSAGRPNPKKIKGHPGRLTSGKVAVCDCFQSFNLSETRGFTCIPRVAGIGGPPFKGRHGKKGGLSLSVKGLPVDLGRKGVCPVHFSRSPHPTAFSFFFDPSVFITEPPEPTNLLLMLLHHDWSPHLEKLERVAAGRAPLHQDVAAAVVAPNSATARKTLQRRTWAGSQVSQVHNAHLP